MKKTGMSLIIILITAVTSGYLLYDYNNYRDELEAQKVSYSELQPEEALDEEIEAQEEVVNEVEEAKSPEMDEDNGSESENRAIADRPVREDEAFEIDDIIYEEETAVVFKVNKETIPDKISLKDKTKLIKIASKLSLIDYGNIAELMNGYDEMGGATEIFNILKSRLSEADYQEIRDILYPYLYVENIEDNMSDSTGH